jgi:parallel beta-helix repeat protein
MGERRVDKKPWIMKLVVIGIVLLFVETCIIPAIAQNTEKSQSSGETWLYVGGSGSGNYTKIQDAINHSKDGDIVYVYQGIYLENVRVNKSIGLLGENQEFTIIDGQETGGHVVSILSPQVTLYRFTLRNSGGIPNAAALYIGSSGNQITENIITCTEYHGEEGIWLSQSTNNIVSRNTIENHHFGIWLENSDQNNLSYNIILNSWDWAIILGNSDNNMLFENNVTENNGGVYLRDSNENTIYRNELVTNYRDIALIDYDATTAYNIIEKNNIDQATFVAAKQARNTNTWDENYWSHPLNHLKLIIGQKEILFFSGIPFHFPPLVFTIPWFNVDWHPAQEPYEIEV